MPPEGPPGSGPPGPPGGGPPDGPDAGHNPSSPAAIAKRRASAAESDGSQFTDKADVVESKGQRKIDHGGPRGAANELDRIDGGNFPTASTLMQWRTRFEQICQTACGRTDRRVYKWLGKNWNTKCRIDELTNPDGCRLYTMDCKINLEFM